MKSTLECPAAVNAARSFLPAGLLLSACILAPPPLHTCTKAHFCSSRPHFVLQPHIKNKALLRTENHQRARPLMESWPFIMFDEALIIFKPFHVKQEGEFRAE